MDEKFDKHFNKLLYLCRNKVLKIKNYDIRK